MEPIEYLRALRRRWVIIALAVVLFLAGAWATVAFAPPAVALDSYQASSILIRTSSTMNLRTIEALVTLRPVVERVAGEIGFQGEGDLRDLAARVTAQADVETGLLSITATGTSAEDSRRLADAFAAGLLGYLEEREVEGSAKGARRLLAQITEVQRDITALDDQLAAGPAPAEALALQHQRDSKVFLLDLLSEQYRQALATRVSGVGLEVIQPAYPGQQIASRGLEVPTSSASRLALGGMLGLVVGVALALAFERFDTRIRSREAAEEHFRLPVLAEIPVIRGAARDRVIAASDPLSPAGEAFRLLGAEVAREPILNGDGDRVGWMGPPKTILVTSATHGEGKSTVVANLAVAFSEMGKSVLVLSCDFRRPAVHRLLGVPNDEGLAEALESSDGKSILEGHIQITSFADIWVVPSGSSPMRPSELLSSGGMRRALQEARSAADVVLLDTAPILAASDAAHLVPEVDAVLVVARSGTTTSELARRTSGMLRRLRAPVLGVAFNGAATAASPKRIHGVTA